MKVIFLDVDGVLNCESTKAFFEGVPFVESEKIKLVAEIVKKTGAKIVLTSNWRSGWDRKIRGIDNDFAVRRFNALADAFAAEGLSFLDYTPKLFDSTRGAEIKAWLDTRLENEIENFVILDDDRDMRPYMKKLVNTSWKTGMTEKDAKRAVKILNEGVDWDAYFLSTNRTAR